MNEFPRVITDKQFSVPDGALNSDGMWVWVLGIEREQDIIFVRQFHFKDELDSAVKLANELLKKNPKRPFAVKRVIERHTFDVGNQCQTFDPLPKKYRPSPRRKRYS